MYIKNIKRILDFTISIILLLLLLPLFVLISFAIKLDSKGSIFFKQLRIGKDNKKFEIYKFRTMYTDAPPNCPTHLLQNSNLHITKVGYFLRRTSLDEIPQLLNIIKGEMSLVGPRPALWNQDNLIALRNYYNINSLRPGLTGWAQINGRDDLSLIQKVELDYFYYRNISFNFDFKCMINTFTSCIRGKGVR